MHVQAGKSGAYLTRPSPHASARVVRQNMPGCAKKKKKSMTDTRTTEVPLPLPDALTHRKQRAPSLPAKKDERGKATAPEKSSHKHPTCFLFGQCTAHCKALTRTTPNKEVKKKKAGTTASHVHENARPASWKVANTKTGIPITLLRRRNIRRQRQQQGHRLLQRRGSDRHLTHLEFRRV